MIELSQIFKKYIKQKLISTLLVISQLKWFKRTFNVWIPTSNEFLRYKLINTPLQQHFHFHPYLHNINDVLIPEWYVLTKNYSDDSITCEMILQEIPNESGEIKHFTLYRNGNRLLHYSSEMLKEEKMGELILETRLVGLKNSLFHYHYPNGIDISIFANKFLQYVEKSEEVTVDYLIPFLLHFATKSDKDNNKHVKYSKESVMVTFLYDETFDEKVLHYYNTI